jgi:thymidylate synthase
MVQYGAPTLMSEHLTGYQAATYYHTVSDAHLYEDQVPFVEEMLARDPLRAVSLTPDGTSVGRIHDFRAEHFMLADYYPHIAISRIPVAV